MKQVHVVILNILTIYIYIYRLIMLCHSWPITFITFYNINLLKWDYKIENSKTYLQILSTTTRKSKSSQVAKNHKEKLEAKSDNKHTINTNIFLRKSGQLSYLTKEYFSMRSYYFIIQSSFQSQFLSPVIQPQIFHGTTLKAQIYRHTVKCKFHVLSTGCVMPLS